MKAVLVATPSVAGKKTDPSSGLTLAEQPVKLAVATPQFGDGTPFTALEPKSGKYLLDAAAANATFTFGALLFRQKASGAVEVFDGDRTWWPEALLDDTFASGAKPAEYAFDPNANAWSATFVLATAAGSDQPDFATDVSTNRPAYGFLSFFRSPKSAPTAWSRSIRGATFGIVSASDTGKVKPGLLQGRAPWKDPKTADGFGVTVKDDSGMTTAELVLSSDLNHGATVVLRYLQGGVERASVALEQDGTVHLNAVRVRIDAPLVELSGELHANVVRYRRAVDLTEQVL